MDICNLCMCCYMCRYDFNLAVCKRMYMWVCLCVYVCVGMETLMYVYMYRQNVLSITN